MTKRQRYFVKQRLIGAGMLIGPFVAAWLLPNLAGVLTGALIFSGFIMLPMSLMCLFSKEMVWQDKTYYDIKYGRQKRETRN